MTKTILIGNREITVQHGTVIYYNPIEGKNFGFILPDGAAPDKTVFFHHSRQRHYYCNGGDVPVIGLAIEQAYQGAQVIFESETGNKGPRASWWAFDNSYNDALVVIAQRPIFRMRSRQGELAQSKLWEKPTYKTLWQGKDITELRKQYPKHMYSLFNIRHSAVQMEQYNEQTDTWEECEDPR